MLDHTNVHRWSSAIASGEQLVNKGLFTMSNTKEVRITFPTTADQKQKLIKLAETNDMNLGQLIRYVLREHLESLEANDQ